MKKCSRCCRSLPLDEFYFVSKATGKRRGQCKRCVKEVKEIQRDPSWLPSCTGCGIPLQERAGPGRRLCDDCFRLKYDEEHARKDGSRRLKLKPCSLCGGEKERFERGKMCSACKPWAGYAKSLRRFGLTPKEYESILALQGGGCYICGALPVKQKLAIDHDHALGDTRQAVRGLICNNCNFHRLPVFQENPELLERAALYLREPPAHAITRKVKPGGS